MHTVDAVLWRWMSPMNYHPITMITTISSKKCHSLIKPYDVLLASKAQSASTSSSTSPATSFSENETPIRKRLRELGICEYEDKIHYITMSLLWRRNNTITIYPSFIHFSLLNSHWECICFFAVFREISVQQLAEKANRSTCGEKDSSRHSSQKVSTKQRRSLDGEGNSSIMKRFAAMDIASTPKKRSCPATKTVQQQRAVQVFATPSVIIKKY